MSKGYGFPAASKMLQRTDQERAYQAHRQKVHGMKAGLDNSPPRRYPHLVLRLKQTQIEKENLDTINHDNKLLFDKMVRIMQRQPKDSDQWDDHHRTLNEPYKLRQLKRIEEENVEIARRLELVRPIYRTERWEDDHRKHLYYLEMRADTTKDYSPRVKKKKKSKEGSVQENKDDNYESDFESDNENDAKSDRLPAIKQDKKKSNQSTKSEPTTSLPKIEQKANEKKKKDQAEADAKQLFKVAKELAQPFDIIIKTLVRRTPKQRQQIKRKFNELYDLDMTSELKKVLGKEWNILLEALLANPKSGKGNGDSDDEDSEDSGSGGESGTFEEVVHSALEKEDIPAVVQYLSHCNSKELSNLKDTYRKEYAISLDADIMQHTEDPEQAFLLTLLKDKMDDGGKHDVQMDATALYEFGDGRWTSSNGKFFKLIEERSNDHVRSVLTKYKQLSNGTSAISAVESECSKSYAKAVAAFMSKSSGGYGKGDKSSHLEHAMLLYKNLDPHNEAFVKTVVTRAEIDMPYIRKAYRKKYKAELDADLEGRSRHPTVKILIALILKNPQPPKTQNGKEKHRGRHGEKKGQQQEHPQKHQQYQQQQTPPEEQRRENKGHDNPHQQDPEQQQDKREHEVEHVKAESKERAHNSSVQKKKSDTKTTKAKPQGQANKRDMTEGSERKEEKRKVKEEQQTSTQHGQTNKHYVQETAEKKEDKNRRKDDKPSTSPGSQIHKQETSGSSEKKEDKNKRTEDKSRASPSGQTKKQGSAEAKGKTEEKKASSNAQSDPNGQTTKQKSVKDADQEGKNKAKEEKSKEKQKGKTEESDDDPKADGDADKLYKAMDGLGTEEDVILDILIKRTNAQRQALKKKYKEKYKKELLDDLKSELGSELEEVLLGLLLTPVQFDAHCVHSSIAGTSASDVVLIGILCTASPKELSAVREEYKKAHGDDLDSALRAKADKKGGILDLLLAMSSGQRDHGTTVSEKDAKEDASKLYRDGLGINVDDDVFKDLMTKKNKAQLKATFAEYSKLSGKTIEESIKECVSGGTEDGLECLVAAIDDPVKYYADTLQQVLKDSSDTQLIRIVVSRSEVDLPAIKSKFQERQGQALSVAIEDKITGAHKKALLKIVDNK